MVRFESESIGWSNLSNSSIYIFRGEKSEISGIWLLPRKTTRIKWFTIMLKNKKIETILFETKGLTSIGSASRETQMLLDRGLRLDVIEFTAFTLNWAKSIHQ